MAAVFYFKVFLRHQTDQGGGGAFAGGTGDANHGRRAFLQKDLRVVAEFDPLISRGNQERNGQWYATRNANQVSLLRASFQDDHQSNFHRQISQAALAMQVCRRLGVGQYNLCPLFARKREIAKP